MKLDAHVTVAILVYMVLLAWVVYEKYLKPPEGPPPTGFANVSLFQQLLGGGQA